MSDLMNEPVMYEMTSEQYVAQIRAAEKRGAIKALRREARQMEIADRVVYRLDVARLREAADRIESGDVTL